MFFTLPVLESGCLNGVMRKQVLRALMNNGYKVLEGIYHIDDIEKAEAIFTTNVTGITIYKNLLKRELNYVNLKDFLQGI